MLCCHHEEADLQGVGLAAGTLAASKFWGGKQGLVLHTPQNDGAALLQCMAFDCAWSTALERCEGHCLKVRSMHEMGS